MLTALLLNKNEFFLILFSRTFHIAVYPFSFAEFCKYFELAESQASLDRKNNQKTKQKNNFSSCIFMD